MKAKEDLLMIAAAAAIVGATAGIAVLSRRRSETVPVMTIVETTAPAAEEVTEVTKAPAATKAPKQTTVRVTATKPPKTTAAPPETTAPVTAESETEPVTEHVPTLEEAAPININTATAEELMLLPHVDEETAEHIIRLREEIGGYSHVYELLYIDELEQKEVAEIVNFVTVGQ
ncbi:MAG: helix-hairpin-helix domain-containing protein [Ruminococcus sp.]|nr:helix-hairpin-helix domain-containing protein [Ruminococcus sp.]